MLFCIHYTTKKRFCQDIYKYQIENIGRKMYNKSTKTLWLFCKIAAIQSPNQSNLSNVFSNKTVRKPVRSESPYAARVLAEEGNENAENPCKYWGFRHSVRSVIVRYFLLKSWVRKKLENRLGATPKGF